MSEKAISLDELRSRLPAPKHTTVFEMDLSAFFPRTTEAEKEPVVFTFRLFSIKDIFGVQELTEIIKRQRGIAPYNWPDTLCQEVACMVLCHELPAPQENNRFTTTLFYCDLFSVDEKDLQLLALLQEFAEKAGSNFLKNMKAMVEEAKKNSSSNLPRKRRSRTVSNTSTATLPK
jgi:hypothetical protein